VSTSPTIPKALSPCLVHRSPSTSAGNTPSSPIRRPMQPGYHRHKDELTVPLRPCCEACEHITDQSLKEGDHWQEKFSRGARRRRSASLENNDLRGESHFSHTRIRNEFFALSKSLDAIGSSQHALSSTFSLTVDEVDKRRKSHDFSEEASSSSSSPSHLLHSPGSLYSGIPRYPRSKPHERDVSSSSTLSSTSTTDEIAPEGIDPRGRLRSSPIEEEDEAELFPLPSPRRSPSGTPSPSPSPKISPAPSPNGSTSCLPAGLIAAGATSARKKSPSPQENISPSKTDSSQESLLKASLSRKQAGGYLAAPMLSTPKSTLPIQSSNTGGLPLNPSLATSPIAAAASTSPTPKELLSERGIRVRTAPRSREKYLSPILTSPPSREPANESPTSQTAAALTRLTPVSIKPVVRFPTSAAIPTPSSPKTPSHGRHVQGRVQPGPQNSVSQSRATSSSPETPSPQKRKHSFTLPFIKAGEAIREAGVDVLKGVNSISSSGGLVGSV